MIALLALLHVQHAHHQQAANHVNKGINSNRANAEPVQVDVILARELLVRPVFLDIFYLEEIAMLV